MRSDVGVGGTEQLGWNGSKEMRSHRDQEMTRGSRNVSPEESDYLDNCGLSD